MTQETSQPPAPPHRSRLRLWIVLILLVGVLFYFGADSIAVYTDDAYVQSDFVPLATEVDGIVQSVAVSDNQTVKSGDTLLRLDPEPFRLALALKQDYVASASADIDEKTAAASVTTSSIDAADAALQLAQQDYDRVKPLVTDHALSEEELNKATDELRRAQDQATQTRSQADVAKRQVDTAKAALDSAKADAAIAAYALSRTELKAPVDGYVTNLTLRPGVYARIGVPVIGLVDANRFRVIGNFKEYIAASLKPGQPVWIWLDSYPWQFFHGRVESVGRGIARADTPAGLLPYVTPTTNWIRLVRRLPVTISFDPPTPEGLHMGADARILIVR